LKQILISCNHATNILSCRYSCSGGWLAVVSGIPLVWFKWTRVSCKCSLSLTNDRSGFIVDPLDWNLFSLSL